MSEETDTYNFNFCVGDSGVSVGIEIQTLSGTTLLGSVTLQLGSRFSIM